MRRLQAKVSPIVRVDRLALFLPGSRRPYECGSLRLEIYNPVVSQREGLAESVNAIFSRCARRAKS